MNVSPEILFLWTYIVSALTSVGGLLVSTRLLTARLIIGTALVYGGLGSSAGMFICFKWFNGQDQWTAIAAGMAVGAGAIKRKDITDVLRRLLGVADKDNKHEKDN